MTINTFFGVTSDLNPLKIHPEKITKTDRRMVNDFDYEGIKFPVSKKDYSKIEQKNNICINVFCCENDLTDSVYVSNVKFENFMDLLLITDENKSHYVYIKDFNRFMCNKTKNNNKKDFCKYCLQCFSSEKAFIKHKGNCLKINGNQTVKLRSGLSKFKSYFKQLAVSFRIYGDFESLFKRVQSNDKKIIIFHTLKNVKNEFLAVLLTKLFLLMIDLASQLFFTEEETQSINLLNNS